MINLTRKCRIGQEKGAGFINQWTHWGNLIFQWKIVAEQFRLFDNRSLTSDGNVSPLDISLKGFIHFEQRLLFCFSNRCPWEFLSCNCFDVNLSDAKEEQTKNIIKPVSDLCSMHKSKWISGTLIAVSTKYMESWWQKVHTKFIETEGLCSDCWCILKHNIFGSIFYWPCDAGPQFGKTIVYAAHLFVSMHILIDFEKYQGSTSHMEKASKNRFHAENHDPYT